LSATSQAAAAARQTPVLFASAGQSPLVPVQTSGTSQSPAAGRHSVLAGTKTSAGQSFETPSQLSATSHEPATGRQTAVLCWSPVLVGSAGQGPRVAGQTSVWAASPAAARHGQVDGLMASAGQVALVPVQNSATSHEPVAPRHSEVAGLTASAGQVALVPVQN